MNAHEIVATATRLLAEPERPRGPWITVDEAASLARCGIKLIYREVRAGRLKAVRVGAAGISSFNGPSCAAHSPRRRTIRSAGWICRRNFGQCCGSGGDEKAPNGSRTACLGLNGYFH